jgi:hypothetical protein
VFSGWIWPEMKKVAEDDLAGNGAVPVVSPEVVAWLFGVLSLFCQNKLGDVSPFGWMLQKRSFAYGPHSRVSLIEFFFFSDKVYILSKLLKHCQYFSQ